MVCITSAEDLQSVINNQSSELPQDFSFFHRSEKLVQQTTVILRKDVNGYMCSTDNAQISTGLIHVSYLSELQSLVHHHLTVATDSLWKYLNALLRKYLIVTQLLKQYIAITNQYPNYTRKQIITELSRHFGVSVGVIEAEIVRQYL